MPRREKRFDDPWATQAKTSATFWWFTTPLRQTTLTEALLYMSGATERMGRVEDGTTASDFDPEEIRRKASLNSSVVPVEFEGVKVQPDRRTGSV